MQVFIYFNRKDCPENIGLCQLTNDLNFFIQERSSILKDVQILSDRFTFQKENGETGYAIYVMVDDLFEN